MGNYKQDSIEMLINGVSMVCLWFLERSCRLSCLVITPDLPMLRILYREMRYTSFRGGTVSSLEPLANGQSATTTRGPRRYRYVMTALAWTVLLEPVVAILAQGLLEVRPRDLHGLGSPAVGNTADSTYRPEDLECVYMCECVGKLRRAMSNTQSRQFFF